MAKNKRRSPTCEKGLPPFQICFQGFKELTPPYSDGFLVIAMPRTFGSQAKPLMSRCDSGETTQPRCPRALSVGVAKKAGY